MKRPTILSVSILAGLGLSACDDAPPPSEVRSRISSDLTSVLREANAAYAGGTEVMPGSAASAAMGRLLGGDSDVALRVQDAVARLAGPALGGAAFAGRGAALDGAAFDPDAEVAVLTQKLFTDENHLGDGIYQVPPSLVCTQTQIDASGHTTETIDAACADKLAKAELRVRVSQSGGELRFAIQLDADHDEPLTIGLAKNALSLTLDLDDAWRAAVALGALLGEELPNAELAGQLTGRLEILGAAHGRLTLDIDRAVSIAVAKQGAPLDGPDAFRFASAKAKVLALELDGAAKRGSYALGLGATTAHLAVESLGTTATRDRYDLDLPGLTASAAFAAGQPLEIRDLSLGDRTASISKNGKRASAIDLNPEDGRALSATIALDPATGAETLAVSPRLDLRLAVDHAAWGEAAPVYDVTQVLLDGSVRSDETGDQLQVVSGAFRISTSPASYGFSAAAGQCVAASDAIDPVSSDSYTRWTVAACR